MIVYFVYNYNRNLKNKFLIVKKLLYLFLLTFFEIMLELYVRNPKNNF